MNRLTLKEILVIIICLLTIHAAIRGLEYKLDLLLEANGVIEAPPLKDSI